MAKNKRNENTVSDSSAAKKTRQSKTVKNKSAKSSAVSAGKTAVQGKKPHRPQRNGSRKKNTGGKKLNDKSVKIAFLGGLNEVGKNMTLYEYEDDMIIVDCGLEFPDTDMLGVDLVIPDFSYVEKNREKIKGIIITHGHEDHIGGLAYLLRTCNIPVYSTKLTIGLISGKLKEHGILGSAYLNTVSPGDVIELGKFSVEMIHVNHSIPDSLALSITCGAGTIIQTGDFKIDSTPIDGEMIDLARLSQIGNSGVLALLQDSTNAERPGFTESEKKVGESFEILFRKAGKRRIIVATFASNVHRVQQIINVAYSLGRKVALLGRSLENVVSIGAELGYLNVPDNVLIESDLIKKYPPEKVVLITTGSQGEPMSALARMASSDHRTVEICPNDYVIISATPIPGNEKTVSRVVNELMMLGAEVVYEKMYDVHVSGHACQEELKIMMGLTKPRYFIPVHGEQKHLRKHAALAETVGIPQKNIFIADNGNVVEISEKAIKLSGSVPAGKIYVDGYGVGDVGNVVLRDRKHLSKDGIIVVTAAVDYHTGELISGPEIISRGFVYVKESEELLEEARNIIESVFEDCRRNRLTDIGAMKGRVRDALSRFVYERTKRSPMILPIILEV